MTLPSYAVMFRGRPACPCLAEWLPVFEDELLRRGVIKFNIDIAQLIGGASASAGTHSKGGAFDIWQHDPVTIWVARQMGADATWPRTTGSFANNRHAHGVLTGCPHNGPARYQIDEVKAGGDGLVGNNPDPGPRPLSGRTWREGIEWAKKQGKPKKPRRQRRFFVDLHPVYQRGFDFQRAGAEGIEGVVIKITEGQSVAYGSDFDVMWRNATSVFGRRVAVYHWLRHDSPESAQVANLARHIPDPTPAIWLDVEGGTGGDSPNGGDVRNFLAAAKPAKLSPIGTYLPQWYWLRAIRASIKSWNLLLWNSAYGINAAATPAVAYRLNARPLRWAAYGGVKPKVLQFGSRVKVAGMQVDCNIFRGKQAEFDRLFRVPTSEPDPIPGPEPTGKPARVRVLGYNAHHGRKLVAVRADLHRLEENADFAALSEMGTYGDVPPAPGMVRWHGDLPGAASTPIDFRPGIFEPGTITTGCELLTSATRVGPRGPGPAVVKAKVFNWVKGRLKGNGRWLRVGGFHGIPAPNLNEIREQVGDEQVGDLAALVDQWQGEGLLVITGDFNRVERDPDLDVLEAAGMECVSVGPTFGKRAIDLIYVKKTEGDDKRVTEVDARVRSGGSSDHEAPWVALTISGRKS